MAPLYRQRWAQIVVAAAVCLALADSVWPAFNAIRRLEAAESPVGRKWLGETVSDRVAALRLAYATWIPGLIGRGDVDTVLAALPDLVEQAGRLSDG
jgi:hypothetical protein